MSILVSYKKNITITTLLLVTFAVTGTALVGITFKQTAHAIKENEKLTLLKKLNNICAP